MTRKCYDCGETKNLKGGWVDDIDQGMKNCSWCKSCFFDNEYDNEDVSHVTRENWNNHNYNWELKAK